MTKNNLINPNFNDHGYIQVYTGNGKGKTTAALGLAMRALGRGWNVLIIMFAKGGDKYGELYSFMDLSSVLKDKLEIVQAGLSRVIYKKNITDDDYKSIQKGWKMAKKAIKSEKYELIILDEINIAIDFGIIDLNDVLETLKNKPDDVEIVLTGRNAKKEITDIADLVSEIKPIKHYWDKGVKAREGIEF